MPRDHPPLATRLTAAEGSLRDRRSQLLEAVRQDPAFERANITLYPYDPLENLPAILRLVDDRIAARLDASNRTMIDIGCANGDLGFAFEEAGFSVALLDRSHVAEAAGSQVQQDAPLVASLMARQLGSRAVIFNEDVDDGFDPDRVLEGFARSFVGDPPFERFALGVMVGVLYHLKNPYAAIEKLRRLCDHLVVGTWVMDCLPKRWRMVADDQVVFLLGDRQLADDPSNYWIFTPRSFRVLVERSGWRVVAEHVVTKDEVPRHERWLSRLGLVGASPPDAVRRRVFMLLERTDI